MIWVKCKIKLIVLILVIASFSGQMINAQECALSLQEAQTQFDRGRVELVADLIYPCLKAGSFSREETLVAYKLLIQSALLDEKPSLADETMLEFLKKNPEYEISAADYSGFVYLRSKYDVEPVLFFSANIGLNYTFLTGRSQISISSQSPDISYTKEPRNIFAGAEAILPVGNNLMVAAGINYSSLSFLYTENMLNFGEVSYAENQSRLEMPLSVVYELTGPRKVTAYVRGGAGYALNINTTAKASFVPSDINNGFNRTGEDLVRKDSRIGSDFFLHGGLGGRLKIPRGYINVELRALFGIRNQALHSNPGDLEYYYFYTDDNYRINVTGISLGYTYIFYKPSKSMGL